MRRWLLCAGCLHLAVVLALVLVGRCQLAPGLVEPNGNVGRLSDDNYFLMKTLASWAQAPDLRELLGPQVRSTPLHLRLYLPVALVLGPGLLGVEPVNLGLYLLCLSLLYLMGRQLFGARAGLYAAVAMGLWPAFLLHSVQLFKDPFFVAAFLGLVACLLRLLRCELPLLRGALLGLVGGGLCGVLKLLRWEMWELDLAVVGLGIGLLLGRLAGLRRMWTGNLLGVACLGVVLAGLPLLGGVAPVLRPLAEKPTAVQTVRPEQVRWAGPHALSARLAARVLSVGARISFLRRKAALECQPYPEPVVGAHLARSCQSQLDAGADLSGPVQILRYVPRALQLGLLAPTPGMWLAAGGQAGRLGRLLAGAEMLCFYGVEALALCALYRHRRRVEVWYLALVVLLGCLALGLTAVNLGALYRLRLAYFAVLLVLGAGGAAGWGPAWAGHIRWHRSRASASSTP